MSCVSLHCLVDRLGKDRNTRSRNDIFIFTVFKNGTDFDWTFIDWIRILGWTTVHDSSALLIIGHWTYYDTTADTVKILCERASKVSNASLPHLHSTGQYPETRQRGCPPLPQSLQNISFCAALKPSTAWLTWCQANVFSFGFTGLTTDLPTRRGIATRERSREKMLKNIKAQRNHGRYQVC